MVILKNFHPESFPAMASQASTRLALQIEPLHNPIWFPMRLASILQM
jgi:hypothetical protein